MATKGYVFSNILFVFYDRVETIYEQHVSLSLNKTCLQCDIGERVEHFHRSRCKKKPKVASIGVDESL